MQVTKLGAIDIGSNSIRCLITNVVYKDGYTYYRKVSMVRLPIRLGQEVFEFGKLKQETFDRFLEAMKAYKHLMNVHGVVGFKAVATSAMREAENGKELVQRVKKLTGIGIEIIDGEEEARLIFESKIFDVVNPKEHNFVYIDVGGGSTEISIIVNEQVTFTRSFRIGGVRVMNGLDRPEEWMEMKSWLAKYAKPLKDKAAIGSGGNINKVHKMSMKPATKPLTHAYLEERLELFNSMTAEERVTELGLNFDRADIIVHALPIYMQAMEWAGTSKIYVPKIGVSDGLVRDLYHKQYKAEVEV
ncbi:MAG: Exopolyphosphatase [Bacteroidota bacterium]|jgi:exopolyphosphatase/guanosine-5'-triphosphate,3'-diphosphate pyrophosphatase